MNYQTQCKLITLKKSIFFTLALLQRQLQKHQWHTNIQQTSEREIGLSTIDENNTIHLDGQVLTDHIRYGDFIFGLIITT